MSKSKMSEIENDVYCIFRRFVKTSKLGLASYILASVLAFCMMRIKTCVLLFYKPGKGFWDQNQNRSQAHTTQQQRD
jgi:hypothetical protein